MLTDSYGQGIPYPTLTDKPNAQTLGQGIVEGLTPKSIMVFASATARGATLTAPKAGMVTYLQDAKRFDFYNGTAWQRVVPDSARGTKLVSFTNRDDFTVSVSFGKTFDVIPNVATEINTSAGETGRWHSRAQSITTTGFVLYVFATVVGNNSTWSNIAVGWTATA